MKKFIPKRFPYKTLFVVNSALTGLFFVLLAGTIYLKSVNAAYDDPGCPQGEVPNCPPDMGFSVFFPLPTDCGWFFKCENGIAYCKQCPADLHWNTELDTCDYPERAGCSKNVARRTSDMYMGVAPCGCVAKIEEVRCEGVGNIECTAGNFSIIAGCPH